MIFVVFATNGFACRLRVHIGGSAGYLEEWCRVLEPTDTQIDMRLRNETPPILHHEVNLQFDTPLQYDSNAEVSINCYCISIRLIKLWYSIGQYYWCNHLLYEFMYSLVWRKEQKKTKSIELYFTDNTETPGKFVQISNSYIRIVNKRYFRRKEYKGSNG